MHSRWSRLIQRYYRIYPKQYVVRIIISIKLFRFNFFFNIRIIKCIWYVISFKYLLFDYFVGKRRWILESHFSYLYYLLCFPLNVKSYFNIRYLNILLFRFIKRIQRCFLVLGIFVLFNFYISLSFVPYTRKRSILIYSIIYHLFFVVIQKR